MDGPTRARVSSLANSPLRTPFHQEASNSCTTLAICLPSRERPSGLATVGHRFCSRSESIEQGIAGLSVDANAANRLASGITGQPGINWLHHTNADVSVHPLPTMTAKGLKALERRALPLELKPLVRVPPAAPWTAPAINRLRLYVVVMLE